MKHPLSRANETRATRKAGLERDREDRDTPLSPACWSEKDTWSRDRIRAVEDEKNAAVAPFLCENSDFYRRRFDRVGAAPGDLTSVDSLIANGPVVTKQEMMDDALAHPPYGACTTCGKADWADPGWMLCSTSGSTGAPRVFRDTHFDRWPWEQAHARCQIRCAVEVAASNMLPKTEMKAKLVFDERKQ